VELENYPVGQTRGAKITNVVPGSSAEAAGLRAGDVIVGLDGRKMDSMDDVMHTTVNAAFRFLSVQFIRNDSVSATKAWAIPSFEVVSLEISPDQLAASRVASGNSTDEKAWCERSGLHTAVCVAAGIVVVGVATAILGGRKDRSTERDRSGEMAAQPKEPPVLRDRLGEQLEREGANKRIDDWNRKQP